MIRTQRIALLESPIRLPGHWSNFFVHREHAFGEETHVARSHLLVCPTCKLVWAKLQFLDEIDCWPVGQYCQDCHGKDEWAPVAGSLLAEEGWGLIDESLLAALPPELIKRELTLHLRAYKS